MKKFILVFVMFLISCSSAPAKAKAFGLSGNFSTAPTSASLSNPEIAGILLTKDWADMEPEEGKYNWTSLDFGIQKIINSGKSVSLNIMAGGARTPDWVKAGSQLFSFIDTNKFHPTYGQVLEMPVYWDPVFLQKKKNFINALSNHIRQKFGAGAVKGVMVSFVASINNDMHVPHDSSDISNWKAAGYTTERMLEAGKETISAWAGAFPRASLKLPIAPTHKDLDGNSTNMAESIVNWAYSEYPDRFFAQVNGFSAQTPRADDPAVRNAVPGTMNYFLKLLLNRPQMGLQMLASASLGASDGCRQNGYISPCLPYDVLLESVARALSYGPSFIEYWSQDADNPELRTALKTAREGMLFVIPPKCVDEMKRAGTW